jgi:hypothetical protein
MRLDEKAQAGGRTWSCVRGGAHDAREKWNLTGAGRCRCSTSEDERAGSTPPDKLLWRREA